MVAMYKTMPWIELCSTKIDVTNIEAIYDIKELIETNKDKLFSLDAEKIKDEISVSKKPSLDDSIQEISNMLSKHDILHSPDRNNNRENEIAI